MAPVLRRRWLRGPHFGDHIEMVGPELAARVTSAYRGLMCHCVALLQLPNPSAAPPTDGAVDACAGAAAAAVEEGKEEGYLAESKVAEDTPRGSAPAAAASSTTLCPPLNERLLRHALDIVTLRYKVDECVSGEGGDALLLRELQLPSVLQRIMAGASPLQPDGSCGVPLVSPSTAEAARSAFVFLAMHCFKPTREEQDDLLAGAPSFCDSLEIGADSGGEMEVECPGVKGRAAIPSVVITESVPPLQALRASVLAVVFTELQKQATRMQRRVGDASVSSATVPEENSEFTTYVVGPTHDPHNVRSGPTTSEENVVGALRPGDTCQISVVEGEWGKMEAPLKVCTHVTYGTVLYAMPLWLAPMPCPPMHPFLASCVDMQFNVGLGPHALPG